jgi:hypothetical protein
MSNLVSHWYHRFNRWFAAPPRQGRKVPASARSRRTCLHLEQLENRLVPAVYHVNSLADILIAGKTINPANGKIEPTNTVTLRSAIEAANATPGNNTIMLTKPGVYKIQLRGSGEDNNQTGDFDINPNASSASGSSLTIINSSGGRVFVDGNNLDRVFDINPLGTAPASFTVVFKNFTIQNGVTPPGGGPDGAGGGIRDHGNVSLTLSNMIVKNNRSTGDGAGVVMEDTVNGSWTLTIDKCTIINNHAGDAGGGIDTDGTGNVVINDSNISGNTDINQGAGVYIDAIQVGSVFLGAPMTMTRTIVSNNQALAAGVTASGGGISNAGNGKMTIINCTIAGNFSGGSGGGFSDENNQGTLDIRNSLFLNNSAIADGGAIQEGGPTTSIVNSEIKGNSAGGHGGGIFVNGTTLTLTASTIAGNTAVAAGGGIEIQTTGTGSTITNTTVTRNSAVNNAGANGGGIDAPTGFTGSVSLLNDTINGNFADNGGGVFWAGTTGSTFGVQNTIIAQNFATTAGPDANNPSGTFTDNGGNLIGIAGNGSGNFGFTTTASTQTGSVATPLDPFLDELGNNGGPKVGAPGSTIILETEAPLAGSKAIGKGILTGAFATDERGFPSVTKGNKINVGAVSQAKHK